ncbi:MAG: iron-containing alcohol dehydrogenase [Eubacterium sp.]
MNLMTIPYRTSHVMMKGALNLLKLPIPPTLTGAGMVKRFPEIISLCDVHKALVVTDKSLTEMGLLDGFLMALIESDIDYAIFDGVQPNPTFENIYDGLDAYYTAHCDGVIAFGGGSSMDCAKIIAAKVTNDKPIPNMKGLFKLTRKLPPFFAIPTTAGTGSEATVCAVITNASNHEKFAINDPKLVPLATVLDPELMVGLPPSLTATTGMDALTHAVEAYIGHYDSSFVKEKSLEATEVIMRDLEAVYADGSNLKLRQNMSMASFNAGLAFTRAYVGNVHAIAHNLGGYYNVPHGFANAVILPHVLEFSRSAAQKKLSELALCAGLGEPWDNEEVLSYRFIDRIKEMNKNMGIPETIDALRAEDIPELTKRILKEANPTYPVPRIMDFDECVSLLGELLSPDNN